MSSDNFFDKYELYTEGDSPYCYPGTGVLKNKLGIKEFEIARKAEAEISLVGLLKLEQHPIRGNFDKAHLYEIHRIIFEPFYDFAGKTRKEDISKGNTKFCVWEYIDDQLEEFFGKLSIKDKKFRTLEEVAEFLSYVMAELNIIHPFREGNGRVIREFIREYALSFGYDIDWSKVEKTLLMDAMIESVFNKDNLCKCLICCISKKK